MKKTVYGIFAVAVGIYLIAFPVRAAGGDPGLKQVIADENTVKIYIDADATDENALYQIGSVPAEALEVYPIREDTAPMRTLVMVDNSLSIPRAAQETIGEAMQEIIHGHAENEQFKLATFAEEISYLSDHFSNDYTALSHVADSITYYDQDTYFTDVLYDVINELNAEQYRGYTRIVIFSDGVDGKQIGITREELNKQLEETPYSVYTFGVDTKKNGEQLENMFAISRLLGSEYGIVNELSADEIAGITASDNDLTVYEAKIPEEAKTGGRQSSKLTLSNGRSYIFSVEMPFAIREVELAEEVYPTEAPLPAPTEIPVVEERPARSMGRLIPFLTILILALVAVIAWILFELFSKKNKKRSVRKASPTLTEVPVREDTEKEEYHQTQLIGSDVVVDAGTVLLAPTGQQRERSYKFGMTDISNRVRSFQCELTGEIRIGRRPDNDIVISDDTTVHGHQCRVSVQNGVFYLTDVKDVRNHTRVNDIQLKPELPQVIVNNSRVTIGRCTYVINIRER